MWCLPSAMAFALGKTCSQVVTLPSVMVIALGKVTKNNLFYLFFISHPNKQKIYITNITNITYISSTAHIYHQHHIYITNVTYISQTSHVSQYITNKFTSNPSAPSSTTTIANRSTINNHKNLNQMANETDLVKDSLKHEDRSMPPIDSAQRRRDCMCETR